MDDRFKDKLAENLEREQGGDETARTERVNIVNQQFDGLIADNGGDVNKALKDMGADVGGVLKEHEKKHGARPDVPWPKIGYD